MTACGFFHQAVIRANLTKFPAIKFRRYTMFDNLLAIAVIIIILWLITLALYFYSSRRQQNLQQEIEAVRKKLDQTKESSRG